MLPLKLVRSLVLGEAINNPPLFPTQKSHHRNRHDDDDNANPHTSHHKNGSSRNKINTSKTKTKTKTAVLLFMPTKELVTDTFRLATIARHMGMDLHPTPSLSYFIFSFPSTPSSSPTHSSLSSSSSSSRSTSSWYLHNDAVPLPFPSLTIAPLSHLRSFTNLSKGLFKLVFIKTQNCSTAVEDGHKISNWDCCSLSLFSRFTGDRIDTMDAFSRALAGKGWTLFKTKDNPTPDSSGGRVRGGNSMYLFRKLDSNRVLVRRANGDVGGGFGECRIRDLRLPPLDFGNAPLRILHYIILMTDDIFYLA